MTAHAPGSAMVMDHEFTRPARVVEISRDEAQEDDVETDDFLPPAPPATDDGTPIRVERQPRAGRASIRDE
jgi:hypothetical protein